MAFPSLSGSTQNNLSHAWDMARSIAEEFKQQSIIVRGLASAGTNSGVILHYVDFLAIRRIELMEFASVAGLAEYAQSQIADPAINITTEFTNMVAALDAIVGWVVTNFPKDVSGYLLSTTIAANGQQVNRIFDAASLVGFVGLIDALLATIN